MRDTFAPFGAFEISPHAYATTLGDTQALSERFTALIMQQYYVELLACDAIHVATVKRLAQCEHDINEAIGANGTTCRYAFAHFDDVRRFMAHCAALVVCEAP